MIMALCCCWNSHKGGNAGFLCTVQLDNPPPKKKGDYISIITVLKHTHTLSDLFPYRLPEEVRLCFSVEMKKKGKLRGSSKNKKNIK